MPEVWQESQRINAEEPYRLKCNFILRSPRQPARRGPHLAGAAGAPATPPPRSCSQTSRSCQRSLKASDGRLAATGRPAPAHDQRIHLRLDSRPDRHPGGRLRHQRRRLRAARPRRRRRKRPPTPAARSACVSSRPSSRTAGPCCRPGPGRALRAGRCSTSSTS